MKLPLFLTLMAAVFLLPLTASFAKKAGDLDPSFGVNGIRSLSYFDSSLDDSPGDEEALAVQPDGKIVMVGSSGGNWLVMRCLPNGELDESFGQAGRVRGSPDSTEYSGKALAVALQADGKLLVSGYLQITGSVYTPVLVRYLPDGAVDTGFGTAGKVKLGTVTGQQTLLVQQDGRILVSILPPSGDKVEVQRLNPDGRLDTAFDGDGKWTSVGIFSSSFTVGMRLSQDGAIVIAGTHPLVGGISVTRLLRNGVRDAGFGIQGTIKIPSPVPPPVSGKGLIFGCLALAQDGGVILAGAVGETNDGRRRVLARISRLGTLDPGFGSAGWVVSPESSNTERHRSVAVDSQGRILALSHSILPSGFSRSEVVLHRYLSGGALDSSFSGDGELILPLPIVQDPGSTQNEGPERACSLKLLAGDKALVLAENGNRNDFALIQVSSSGVADAGFDDDGLAVLDGRGKTLQSSTPFTQLADGSVLVPSREANSSWLRVVKFDETGRVDMSFGVEGLSEQATLFVLEARTVRPVKIAVDSEGRIVVAGSLYKGTVDYPRINYSLMFAVRWLPDGSLDSSFGSGGSVFVEVNGHSDFCEDMVIQPDDKILLGGWASFNLDVPRRQQFAIVRLNSTDGSLDTSFDGDGRVTTSFQTSGQTDELVKGRSMLIQPDGKIVLCGTHAYFPGSGQLRGDVALTRYNTDGSPDTGFSGDGKLTTNVNTNYPLFDEGNDIALASDGSLYVCGQTTNLDTRALIEAYVIHYLADGMLDATFGTGGMVRIKGDQFVEVLVNKSDNPLVMGGNSGGIFFRQFQPNGAPDSLFGNAGLARLPSNHYLVDALVRKDGTILGAGVASDASGGQTAILMRFIGETRPEIEIAQTTGIKFANGASTASFGDASVGAPLSQAFTVSNAGGLPLGNLAVSLSGDHAADFSLGSFVTTALNPDTSRTLTVTFTPKALGARTATLSITSNDADESPFEITLSGIGTSPAAPMIAQQPLSKLIMAGLPAELSAAGAFGPPFTLVWFKGTTALKGATSPTLAFSSVASKDAGTYRLRITNAHSSVDSQDAHLGVIMPSIPVVILKEGSVLTLTCTAYGPDLDYLWYKDGDPVPAATGVSGREDKTLKVTGVTPVYDGIYTCRVTLGSVAGPVHATHGDTVVTVQPKPVITLPVLPERHVSQLVNIPVAAAPQVTRWAATGLPPGIKIDPINGTLSGRATAAKYVNKVLTAYSVVITATNTTGSSSTASIPWMIYPLPDGLAGTYEAWIDFNSGPVGPTGTGYTRFTITATGTGTATLENPQGKKSATFTINPPTPPENAATTLSLADSSGILTLTLSIDPVTRDVTGTEFYGNGVHGWRCPHGSTNKIGYKGVINTALRFSGDSSTGTGTSARPRGHGYGQATVADVGTVNWAGILADGTSFTAGHLIGNGGRTLLYVDYKKLYGAQARRQDGLIGNAVITPGQQGISLAGSAFWYKREQTTANKTRSYAGGFTPRLLNLEMRGREYIKPGTNDVVLGLGTAPNNAKILVEEGGLESSTSLLMSLDKAGKSKVEAGTTNTLNITLNVAPATGMITGGFSRTDANPLGGTAIPRLPKLFGLIVQHPEVNVGIGHFNLAELPDALGETKDNTPLQSGRLELAAP